MRIRSPPLTPAWMTARTGEHESGFLHNSLLLHVKLPWVGLMERTHRAYHRPLRLAERIQRSYRLSI